MIRKGFQITLRPGAAAEYEARHNPIGRELRDVLKRHGVNNYSIFLDRGSDRLFAYAEIQSEQMWHEIALIEVCPVGGTT
jgi:L-rhamnose mutarotase